jgi:hypothetical protein
MKKLLLSCLTISLLAISCKKDDDNGDGSANQFMSTTPGNYWVYRTTDANGTSTDTMRSSSRDTIIQARSFHVYDYSSGGMAFYNITGTEYYNYVSFSQDPLIELTNRYLVTTAPKGTSWLGGTTSFTIDPSTIIPGAPPIPLTATVTLNNTMMNTDTTVVINGRTYSNVMYVRSNLNITGIPTLTVTSDIDSYYAKKYGEIFNHTVINTNLAGELANTTTTLLTTNF